MLLSRKKKAKESRQTPPPESGKLEDILELGTFYFLNQKYDEAAAQFENAIKMDPMRAKTYYNLGVIYEIQNRCPDARTMLSKAIELDPHMACAQTHLDKLVGG